MNALFKWWNDPSKALQFHAFLRLGTQILLGILPVKLGYEISQTSQLELYLFYGAALSFFITGALNKTILTNNGKTAEFTALLIGSFLTVLSAVAAWCIAYSVEGINPYLLSGLVLALPLANSIEHFILIHKKLKWLFVFSLSYIGIYLIVISLLFFWHRSIEEVITAIIGIHLFKSLLVLVFARGLRPPLFQKALFHTFVDFLGIALLGGLMNFLDGFILNYLFPEYPFSVFRYGARELPLLNIIFTSMAAGFILTIQQKSDWQEQMKRRLKFLLNWSFPLVALLFFLSPYVYEWVFSSEYRVSAIFFNIYLLMLLFRVMIGQSVLMAYKKERILLILTGVELAGNIVFSIVFGLIWGILGIMFATVLAYAIHKVLLVFYLSHKLNISISSFFPIKSYAAMSLLLMVSFYISWQVNFTELWP
ncbi:MAG TPA: polysaccharide biosynthesis C-terminal domain-containing protein [Saprospiraceae bacterium]|nr:polysaccharide biosynthesis C-terminal domain-containing protein [Saprospiraceae bacterium]